MSTILFMWVRAVQTLSSSERMSAVKVMVTIVVNDFSNSQKVRNIITAPWQILFHTQIRNVFRFSYRPFCRLWYNCGNQRTFQRVTSQSKIRQSTGSIVQTVEQPSIKYPLQIGIATEQNTNEKMDWMIEMMSPLWITNCAMTEVFLQASLPCQSTNFERCLNLRMEKSEANAACLPYFPTIPTPMSATWIIPTSLPPSPIPSTILPVWSFTPWVITAFWVGETRQQITAGAYAATVQKKSGTSWRATASEDPSITKTVLVFIENSLSLFLRVQGSFCYLMTNNSWVGDLRPADIPMQIAVSTLSPVIIHTLMPAFLICEMHS